MYAVILTGGKQYRVEKNDYVKVDKLALNVGDTVELDAIMFSDGEKVLVGDPVLANVKVTGEVLRQDKEKKVIVFKYKAKKNERKKQGHRQPYTLIKISNIVAK